jgi:hypothetical protein
MTWKQLEATRERRLWLTQVIMPAIGFVTTLAVMRPDLVENAKVKAKECANKIKAKFNK